MKYLKNKLFYDLLELYSFYKKIYIWFLYMSGLEVNKIIASLIMVFLIIIFINVTGNILFKKQGINDGNDLMAYLIDIPEEDTYSSEAITKNAITAPISTFLMNASVEKGEKLFKKCGACHSYNKDGANKVGPNLWNLINRPKGSVNAFSYSKALSEFGGKWTFEELSEFLYKPKQYIEKTKMNFAGLKEPEDRANLILFIREQSDEPAPLP
jgi:cytochrome c